MDISGSHSCMIQTRAQTKKSERADWNLQGTFWTFWSVTTTSKDTFEGRGFKVGIGIGFRIGLGIGS